MKYCRYCGAELPSDARACSNCGRPCPDAPSKEEERKAASTEESSAFAGTDVNTDRRDPFDAEEKDSRSRDPYGNAGQQQGGWGRQDPDQPQNGWNNQNQNGWGTQNPNQPQNGWNGQNPGQPQGGWNNQNPGQPQNGWNGQNSGQPQGGWNNPDPNQPQNGWNRQNPNQNGWGSQNPNQPQNGWNNQNPNPQQGGWRNPNPWNGQNQPQNPWNNQNQPQSSWNGQGGADPQYAGNTEQKTNIFAVFSLVFGIMAFFMFFSSILGIIFGAIGLSQIKRYPERFKGKRLAIIGIVVSVVFIILYAVLFVKVFQALQDPETLQMLQEYLNLQMI